MARFDLSGQWERAIAGQVVDTVPVPGCYRPVGECELRFGFEWQGEPGRRVFLVTEGVMATAAFTLNGVALGQAGPWATYRFEIPEGLLQPYNTITARLRDLPEPFGTTPGRRYDAGLFRPIYLETRPCAYLASVSFTTVFDEDMTRADCAVTPEVDGEPAPFTVTLTERATGRVVARGGAQPGGTARFTVEWPRLWSPETPNLYTLATRMGDDEVVEEVGFRRLEVRGRDLFLNNNRLVLRGVCRHEFTSRHGYCPTEPDVRRELALIKHSGFNYVRLVHSPQSPLVPRVAAEIGLLVSEEPGTCWHDLADPQVAAPALETLRRTVYRDRNVPSILAFYLYNECEPVIEYARQAAALCRAIVPGCLLSFADASQKDDLLQQMAAEADLSFYGVNHYSIWHGDLVARMDHFKDRPVVFTEWGGCLLQGNRRQLLQFGEMFVRQTRPQAEPRTAGFSFWAWADYEEHSRPEPASYDGWTVEGLLDQQGLPREDLATLSRICFDIQHPQPLHRPDLEILARSPRRSGNWTTLPLDGVEGDQLELEAAIAAGRTRFQFCNPTFGRIVAAGIPFDCREDDGIRPLLLGQGRETVTIPVGRRVRAIAVLGHVALRGGYPANETASVFHSDGERVPDLGAPASRYRLVFADGTETVPLRHGEQVLRSNNICRWWKTVPTAPCTTPGVQAVLHPSYEILRFDIWETRLAEPRELVAIRWELDDPGAIQAMLALTVEEAQPHQGVWK